LDAVINAAMVVSSATARPKTSSAVGRLRPRSVLPTVCRKIHVDHDHSCCRGVRSCGKCVRGIACEPCNKGIGAFGDDPERLMRVAERLAAASAEVAARRAAAPVQAQLFDISEAAGSSR
jgi:hypothetical protein